MDLYEEQAYLDAVIFEIKRCILAQTTKRRMVWVFPHHAGNVLDTGD